VSATKVRSRLVLAFAYILVTVIVTLEAPLVFNLQRRVRAEATGSAENETLLIAADIGAERTTRLDALQKYVQTHYPATTEDGRVIVVDPDGVLIADSLGPDNLGTVYATPKRPELVSVLRNQRPYSQIRHSVTLGEDILVSAAPILDEGKFYGVVRLTQAMGRVQERVRAVVLGLVVIGVAALAAGLIIAFALAGSLSRPLAKLAAAAQRLGTGDLTARADTSQGATEIRVLAESFDEMADRLEQTVKAQREFVANASHQLRTPLTGMKLRLESAIEHAKEQDLRRQLEAADKEVDRLAEIVQRLLLMARRIERGGPGEVDLSDAVGRAIERWSERAARRGATLDSIGEGGRALADETDLDQVLDNLLDNAISYAPGPVLIETGRTDGNLFVAVEDRGPGIPADERRRVMDRFFRGRNAPPGGSGLGLAIVRELVERWGGAVTVTAGSEGGTRVEIRLLPIQGEASPSAAG
jgi:signal transduction histidine kinase